MGECVSDDDHDDLSEIAVVECSSYSSSSRSSGRSYLDLLTVFQAAPLVYETGGQKYEFPLLDFEFEQDLLTQTFAECGNTIKVEFEVATTHRLSLFLAEDVGRILHFSCHGHPQYLALEDNWGGMMMLEPSRIKEWIEKGGKNLQFVFVAACHSTMIAQAFVDAGVPHVVCCGYDSEVPQLAAVEFERFFYRNLACGRKLQNAFDVACQEIMVSPNIPEERRAKEVEKFRLFPPTNDHDVDIFFQRPIPDVRRKTYVPTVLFPPPPQHCLGRGLDQYAIIQALERGSRLIRVTGDKGVGKAALVKSCCQYVNDRLHMVGLNDILWFPYPEKDYQGPPFNYFSQLFEMLADMNDRTPMSDFLLTARDCMSRIIGYFKVRKSLVVIEAKHFLLPAQMARISLFIDELLSKTKYVKILMVHDLNHIFSTPRTCCSEEVIQVEKLDLQASVALFARTCPHLISAHRNGISTPKELVDLVSSSLNSSERLTKRLHDVYQMVGGGNPRKIHQIARTMTEEEYDRLISLVRQNEMKMGEVKSRASLLQKQKELSEEISKAALLRDFDYAQQLQSFYDDLELQMEKFPDVMVLQERFDEVTYQIQLAVSAKDFHRAKGLQTELDELELAIRIEKDVENVHFQDEDADVLKTRASLEAKIIEVDEEYNKACDANDFKRAREMNAQGDRLKEFRSRKPSRKALASKARQLKSELDNAKATRNLDVAEMVYKRLIDVKARLKLEEEAEKAFGISVGEENDVRRRDMKRNDMRRDGMKRNEMPLNDMQRSDRQCSASIDPPDINSTCARSSGLDLVVGEERREKRRSDPPVVALRLVRPDVVGNTLGQTTQRNASSEVADRASMLQEKQNQNGDVLLRVDYSSDEESQSEAPGAVAVSGDGFTDRVTDLCFVDDATSQSDSVGQASALAPALAEDGAEEPPLAAEVVNEHLILESLIMETMRKNTVQATMVTLDDTSSHGTARKKSGFGRFFRRKDRK